MAKVLTKIHDGETLVRYHCPGCKHDHWVPAKQWNWNGDKNKPSLHPSVRHFITFPEGTKRAGQQQTLCHYHVKNGQIKYCGDCEHELKGKTVDLPEMKEEEGWT